MNEFLKDGTDLIRRVVETVASDMTSQLQHDAILGVAVGLERLLKGILYDVNPVYVYKAQDFKNTVGILYGERLIPGSPKSPEVEKNPNRDVLSFRASLSRAALISETTAKHKSLLYSLSHQRDVIVHARLSQLDHGRCRDILFRDLYSLLRDFSNEVGVPFSKFVGNAAVKLAKIASEHQIDIGEKVRIKLEAHRAIWNGKQKQVGQIEKAKERTAQVMRQGEADRTTERVIVTCPACEQDAIVKLEPDYDVSDGEGVITGLFVSGLRCFFCKLHIEEYEEIDTLKLDELAFGYEEPDL